jgi:hypothetical protein
MACKLQLKKQIKKNLNTSNTYNLAFKSQNWVSSVIQGLLGRQPDMMASLDENCSLYLTILKSKWENSFLKAQHQETKSMCTLIDQLSSVSVSIYHYLLRKVF